MYFLKGRPLDFGHLSFRATLANLSQSLRIKSLIWHLHMEIHIFTYYIIFRDFRGARLLSRSFANQHFPFAHALQINRHIKVNVWGFFRSSIDSCLFLFRVEQWYSWTVIGLEWEPPPNINGEVRRVFINLVLPSLVNTVPDSHKAFLIKSQRKQVNW